MQVLTCTARWPLFVRTTSPDAILALATLATLTSRIIAVKKLVRLILLLPSACKDVLHLGLNLMKDQGRHCICCTT